MPQTARNKTARSPRQKTGDAAIREMVENGVSPGGGPVTIPTTDSANQAHVRQLVEKMRKGKNGKPYIVEVSRDGSTVTVSLPEQPVTAPTTAALA